MAQSREATCASTSRKLSAGASGLGALKAVVGLDGFVDHIIAVVDTRYADGRFEAVKTIGAFGDKIRAAAGESSNYELVVAQSKLGGNGPIMANALATLGFGVTYIGSLGYPEVSPVFRELAAHARIITIAEPGVTDALEFEDGKIMLGKHQSLHEVNWGNLVARVGKDQLRTLFGEATLVGMVNWTMLAGMSRIWEEMQAEGLLSGGMQSRRTLFVDLADPEKRTPEDLRAALGLVGKFQGQVDVILGLNLKEAMQVEAVLGLPSRSEPEATIAEAARAIRASVGVACVVIHPRRGAAAATEAEVAHFAGPFVKQPRISTGAGDHFNAGFCLGRILGLGLEECLCAGVSTSGYYVREAQSPSLAALAEFAGALPPPEG